MIAADIALLPLVDQVIAAESRLATTVNAHLDFGRDEATESLANIRYVLRETSNAVRRLERARR